MFSGFTVPEVLQQVFPEIYHWTTFPLTLLLSTMGRELAKSLAGDRFKLATLVEFCSVVERALNYMHTGNAAVILQDVMNPLWVGRALLVDGFPCFNSSPVQLTQSHLIEQGSLG